VTAADLHTLAGAFALDAVDDVERAAFTRHLAECDACAAEVAEFREAAVGMSALLTEVPSPALRGGVLDTIGRTRQAGPEEFGGRAPAEPLAAARPRPPRRALRGWRRIAAGAVAASLIAVAGGVAAWTISERRVATGRAQIAALEAERERMYDVFNAPDVQMKGANVEIDGQVAGRIAAAVSPSQDAGVAMIAGLPTLPGTKSFQMWLIDSNDQAVNVGTLASGQTGGTMLFDWQSGAVKFGLSIEPGGGAASIPTDVVGLVDLFA
jgi:anti-sigma factor RsiW